MNERVEACKSFIERDKNRLVWTEAVIVKPHEQNLIFETELRENEARLLQLQTESEAQQDPLGPSVAEFQRRIDQLVQERDVLQTNPPKTVPSRSVGDRQNSSHARGPTGVGRVVELPQLRASEHIGVRGRYHGGQSGSSGGTREDGDVRAECPHARPDETYAKEKVHRGHTNGWESSVRNSRHGLRVVRLGEAYHPGFPGRRTRDSAEDFLDNLKRELHLIESDDEPLVRPTIGQNVDPRTNAGESILVQQLMVQNGSDCSEPVKCGHVVNVVQIREQPFTNAELSLNCFECVLTQCKEEGHQSISLFATFPLPDTRCDTPPSFSLALVSSANAVKSSTCSNR